LREAEIGYGVDFPAPPQESGQAAQDVYKAAQTAEREHWASQLFGGYRGDDEGDQSPLVVHDAPGQASGYELRDGVAIDGTSRTADDKKKFDIQLLAAGSVFQLRFELAAGTPKLEDEATTADPEAAYTAQRDTLLRALATVLEGVSQGKITLGARKRRGYGRCSVDTWHVTHYDLQTRSGFLGWLVSERDQPGDWLDSQPEVTAGEIGAALGVKAYKAEGLETVTLHAEFRLPGALMIRSGFGQADVGPDMVHLRAIRPNGQSVPVIPGPTWAGVLRHRAEKIIRTLLKSTDPEDQTVRDFVDSIFGPDDLDNYESPFASRLVAAESEILDGHDLVQTRIRIDSLTGGAYESALFDEQPVFGKPETSISLDLTLHIPAGKEEDVTEQVKIERRRKAEIGLLLLLLKDLWTGDLRIGGESSVGRGRLAGYEAVLTVGDEKWRFSAENGGVKVNDPQGLEAFVDAFGKEVAP
jgi:CRISPR/Cas system CSM-associated protein Csm3 (group 7 of RAMP superfamily)